MKITCIFAHRVELPLRETTYKWSGGKSVTAFDSTIVGVETDTGIAGYGAVCPLGPFSLPAYGEGVRAGLRELGPHLLGEDPRHLAGAAGVVGREGGWVPRGRLSAFPTQGRRRS